MRRSPGGSTGISRRMRPEDLVRVGRLVLDGGRWGDTQSLPEAWIDEMLRPLRRVGPNVGYGYLWWTTGVPSPGSQMSTFRFAHTISS